MLSASLALAALPVGLLLVFTGFTAVRAASVLGPPVITLPWGGPECNSAACASGACGAAPGRAVPPRAAAQGAKQA